MNASSMLSRCLVARVRRVRPRLEPAARRERPQPDALDHRLLVVDRQHALRAAGDRVQAGVGRDPVQPRARRAAALEAVEPAPRTQQRVLQRVLGVLDGAEHPVAVRLQLAAMRLDEAPVGRFVVGECGRAHRHPRVMDPVDPLEPLGGGPPASTSFRIARVLPPGRFAVPVPAQERAPAAAARRAGPSLSILFVLVVILARARLRRLRGRARASSTTTSAARPSSSSSTAWAQGRLRGDVRAARRAVAGARTRRSRSSPTTGARTARRRSRRSRSARVGPLLSGGTVRVPVTVRPSTSGRSRAPSRSKRRETEDGVTRIAWSREQRLPGLRKGEEVRRSSGAQPQPREHLRRRRQAAELRPARAPRSPARRARSRPAWSASTTTASAARRSSTLRFGDRVIARVEGQARPLDQHHDPPRPAAQRAERAGRAAGRDRGDQAQRRLRARAGRARGLRPAAARLELQDHHRRRGAAARRGEDVELAIRCARPRRCRGVALRNAGDESCGGSLTNSFAHSCNSVFGPLGRQARRQAPGRRRRALRLQRAARDPGGEGQHDPAPRLKDSLAVGASAIGQDRTSPPRSRWPRWRRRSPTGAYASSPGWRASATPRKRVVSAKVAGKVRDMMVAVVQGGTGRAAAIPGVTVAGKTGTAELVSTADIAQNAKNTTAWFVAFAPASTRGRGRGDARRRRPGRRLRGADRQARPAGRALEPRRRSTPGGRRRRRTGPRRRSRRS